MRKGIGVSPGVAVGTAYCIHEIFVNPNTRRLADAEVRPELARYEQAREATAGDLRALHAKVSSQVGQEQAAVFLAHESILHDPAFTEKIRHWIVDERQSATAALHNVMNEYADLFARTKDEYIKERRGRCARRDRAPQRPFVRRTERRHGAIARPTDSGGRRTVYPRKW